MKLRNLILQKLSKISMAMQEIKNFSVSLILLKRKKQTGMEIIFNDRHQHAWFQQISLE